VFLRSLVYYRFLLSSSAENGKRAHFPAAEEEGKYSSPGIAELHCAEMLHQAQSRRRHPCHRRDRILKHNLATYNFEPQVCTQRKEEVRVTSHNFPIQQLQARHTTSISLTLSPDAYFKHIMSMTLYSQSHVQITNLRRRSEVISCAGMWRAGA